MEDVTRVEWREWGQDAFDEADRRDVPVLLSLTATWCDHCHEMDEATYNVPTIAANVNDGFVPIRVDVDRRPRVRDRYNMGGFPSTVFLTPDGTVLTGAGYLGEDGMRQVIESVRRMWAEKGADAGRVPRPLRDTEPPSGALDDVEAALLARLEAAYDEAAGGWGEGAKFPLPDALEFALKRDREMALRCFDAVSANLLDEYEGGFYRFATGADWSGIQHEKLLDENAALVRAFSHAYCYTGRDEYREPAHRTIEYLTTTLWNGEAGAFAGSQAPADPETYTLEPSDRESGAEPPVDDTVYAGANALAIDACCTYYGYTDDERARRYAERALEFLRTALLEDGVAFHSHDTDCGEPGDERPLLVNQARALAALTTARSVLGADVLETAEAVVETTIDRLRDGDSFVDGPEAGVGLCDRPLRPLDSNVEFADALVDLAVLTGENRYRTIARETLEDFAGASDRFGPQVARYGSVATRLCEGPLVVRVADPAGSDLHRAAVRIADHEKVVVPEADLEAGSVRVDHGSRRSEPATTPEELSDRVQSVLE
ncbi:DUF255 domain-containing protein [Natrialbaceae archaeon AArc-T1-2]|uniref:DUF255 domain-containing protein n=1 Tax=Natrialbaceae archaeon AArc-T1-2 TaxID=3053904 RepID=UPI00255AFA15|nr:DUF255 domain-containing protein [Natrialbaceae archaeon AArc-T1-2]WIV67139.1 DUF255 domain-containing protein [Natrialbaceae archaeon AArc-T1-2]